MCLTDASVSQACCLPKRVREEAENHVELRHIPFGCTECNTSFVFRTFEGCNEC